jgi:hypothetical protein
LEVTANSVKSYTDDRIFVGEKTMHQIRLLLLVLILTFVAGEANAKEKIHQFNIADFMANPSHLEKLEGVKYFFGDQAHAEIVREFGDDYTNPKTNAFGKKDAVACDWVMLSAMLALQRRAQQLGANAVINIRSNYKHNLVSSTTEFTCGAGAFVAGVSLIGTFVTIDQDVIEKDVAEEVTEESTMTLENQ